MTSVLNFKPFTKGSILGFFSLRYHGLAIQNCKLMAGSNGGPAWFSFPQIKTDQDGTAKYFDILHLSNPEREAVRKLVMIDLQQQGYIERVKPKPRNGGRQSGGQHQTPEGEDLSEYYSEPGGDIPF
jgi:hypothetical protein